MSVLIGITSFNTLEYLKNNIDSIVKYTDTPFEIFVVDNNSSDGTKEYLEKNSQISPRILSENTFASGGARRASEYFLKSKHDYFLHLDCDVEIRNKNWLDSLIKQLDSKLELGAIGDMIHGLRYEHPKARSLKLFDSYIFDGSWQKNILNENKFSSLELKKKLLEKHPTNDYLVYKELCGNIMIFKREAVEKIGVIDDKNFQMWRWDSEYTIRLALFDYKIARAEAIDLNYVYHYGGRSRLKVKNEKRYQIKARELGQ